MEEHEGDAQPRVHQQQNAQHVLPDGGVRGKFRQQLRRGKRAGNAGRFFTICVQCDSFDRVRDQDRLLEGAEK